MMAPTDFPSINAMSEVTRDLLIKIGIKVDYVATDWGSDLRRQANREVPAKGGYNLFCTYSPGITHYTPAAHSFPARHRRQGDLRLVGEPRAGAAPRPVADRPR